MNSWCVSTIPVSARSRAGIVAFVDASAARRATDDEPIVRRTRTGSAWLMVAAALLLGLLMLVFILQNDERVTVELLWAEVRLPLGVAVLFGMVLGGLLVLLVGAARLAQVRLAARRHRRSHRTDRADRAGRAEPTAPTEPTEPTEPT